MDVKELVRAFNGYSIAIVSDDAYGAVLFVSYLTSAMCLEREDVIFVVYGESTCNRLQKITDSLRENNYCVNEFLRDVRVIKIGKTPEISFGKPVAFVEDNGVQNVAAEVGRIIKNRFNGSTVFFFGFNVGMHIYNTSEIVRALEELFSWVDSTMYFVISSTTSLDLIANVFDIVVRISRIESFGMRPGNVYNVYVEHSIIEGVQQIPLYRLDEFNVVEF